MTIKWQTLGQLLVRCEFEVRDYWKDLTKSSNEKDYKCEGVVAVDGVYHYLRYVCRCDYIGRCTLSTIRI